MPHFGLMSTGESFNSREGALLRSRLHIRAGKRRLLQSKISAGIVTLYDALIFALDYYISFPEHLTRLTILPGEDLKDDAEVYRILLRSKVIGDGFDYEAFNTLVEEAMNREMPDYDFHEMLAAFERLMQELEVMPFDETKLPPEDPSTF